MADMNVELLKEKLYKVSKSLFCIGEACVEASKQHVSLEDALDKIRGYLSDSCMESRFQVDQLIEDCMEPIVSNIDMDAHKKDILNRLGGVFYVPGNMDELIKYKADADRIAIARDNIKKYIME